MRFRRNTIDFLVDRWFWLTSTTIISHLLATSCCSRFWFVGVSDAEVNWAQVLGVFAFARLLTAVPITPGGLGIVEVAYIGGLILAGRGHGCPHRRLPRPGDGGRAGLPGAHLRDPDPARGDHVRDLAYEHELAQAGADRGPGVLTFAGQRSVVIVSARNAVATGQAQARERQIVPVDNVAHGYPGVPQHRDRRRVPGVRRQTGEHLDVPLGRARGAPSRRRTLGSAPDHLGASAPASRSHPHSWPLPQRCPSAGTPTRASRRLGASGLPGTETRFGWGVTRTVYPFERASVPNVSIDAGRAVRPAVWRPSAPGRTSPPGGRPDRPVRDVLGEPRGAGPGATGRRSRPAAQRDRILGTEDPSGDCRIDLGDRPDRAGGRDPAPSHFRRSGVDLWHRDRATRARTGARTGRRCPLPPTGPTSSSILGRSRAP